MTRYLLIAFLFLFSSVLLAQQRSLQAVKINQPIKIDGDLNDAAWQNIDPATDFIMSFPSFGKPASKKTVVKIAYDNAAVYVGAYMYDNPSEIKKGLTTRDVIELQNTDYFSIGLDTYKDDQNGFLFEVTAAGVQGDVKISQNFDRTWDAVWESKVSIKKDGWVAEIKIPFSAIRFSKKNIQTWGLQFGRFVRKINESETWSPDNPGVNGTINKWGNWEGLKDITPPLRLSFSPYLSGGIRVSPVANGNVTNYLKSGGMDVKYGISESFTLDMTLIPDFAQVQSDNVILNLTPFEVKFDEYRPFFTEGTELFNKANLFYARRIGATPQGSYDVLALETDSPQYKIIKNPGITNLYNATKISGRTKHNLGIGILNAISAPMHAIVEDKNNGNKITFETEPLTNYNVLVLDQALKNRSSITVTNTNVLRKGNSRNANVTGLNISVFDKRNVYGFLWDGVYSAIWGRNGNKDGYRTDLQFGKISGLYQYNFSANILSDTYDPNDLGFLTTNNVVKYTSTISYNNFTATKRLLNQSYQLTLIDYYLYNPYKWQNFGIDSKNYIIFKNYWDVTIDFSTQPFWSNDFFEPRTPGKFLKRPPVYFLTIEGSSDSRKKLFYNYNFSYGESPLPHDPYYSIESGFRFRFNDKFQVSADEIFSKDRGNYGFVYRDNIGAPIIGERNIKINTTVISSNYNFNPKMNLSIRLRHYWSQVHYLSFYDLKDDGYWASRNFTPGFDQNFNTFNVDMFYTWDFLLGSRITFAWKNALGANVNIDGITNNTYIKNFSRIFDYPHSNEVSLKIVYYLDYLTLKKQYKHKNS
jgi:hypothetical protein